VSGSTEKEATVSIKKHLFEISSAICRRRPGATAFNCPRWRHFPANCMAACNRGLCRHITSAASITQPGLYRDVRLHCHPAAASRTTSAAITASAAEATVDLAAVVTPDHCLHWLLLYVHLRYAASLNKCDSPTADLFSQLRPWDLCDLHPPTKCEFPWPGAGGRGMQTGWCSPPPADRS
jgi:hypothetical protein